MGDPTKTFDPDAYLQNKSPEMATPEWSEVPRLAASNLGPSAARFAGDIAHMVTSPVETGESLWNLAAGAAQKIIPDSWTDGPMGKEKYADAMGQFFAERYGGEDEIKKTLATDPVGVLADFSTFLTGGAMLAAKAPMVAAKTAQVVGKVPGLSRGARIAENAARFLEPTIQKAAGAVGNVGKWADPLYTTARGTAAGAKLLAPMPEALLGQWAGLGSSSVREAATSGFADPYLFRGDDLLSRDSGETLRGNMRSTIDYDQVVADAKSGLQQMKDARNAEYRSGMVDVSNDRTVLDFGEIDAALTQAFSDNTFKGVAISEPTAKALKDLDELVTQWRSYDPVDFHTPEGMDKLKQSIGSLVDWKSNNPGQQAKNIAAQTMYAKVGELIRKQAPAYDKLMTDYSKASQEILDIEKSFNLGKKSDADSSLRKLTSIVRNTVNTNYGARLAQGRKLETASGRPLIPALAGQSMSSMNPRGLAGTGLQTMGPVAAAIGTGNYGWLAALPFQSPRLVGETVHGLGRTLGTASKSAAMTEALLGKGGMSSRGLAAAGYQLQRPELEDRRILEEEYIRPALKNYPVSRAPEVGPIPSGALESQWQGLRTNLIRDAIVSGAGGPQGVDTYDNVAPLPDWLYKNTVSPVGEYLKSKFYQPDETLGN